MPCKPAKARKLLRDGKALVINHSPFTIQLLWNCEENVQPVTVGIDKGSHVTGVSCVANGQILLSTEIHHRTDIKDKMTARRNNRRLRRSRKWYRSPRYLNRVSSRRSGRLPPSIRANVEEVIRVVRQIPLLIGEIIIEDVQVDIARLNNPNLTGKQYQTSSRLDENLRIATLMRDGYQCQHCDKKNTRLEAHHIIYTSQGGKDTLDNLITLCAKCHDKIHKGKITLDTSGVSGFIDQIAQRTMQGKTYMYKIINKITNIRLVFGYQISFYRKERDLPKTHDSDALCVATLLTREIIPLSRDNFYSVRFRPRQTRRQYHDLPRKEKGRVPYQVNFELEGFRKGDMVRVKGKWIKQINSIYSNGRLAFARVKGEPGSALPRDCQLLRRGQTVIWKQVG